MTVKQFREGLFPALVVRTMEGMVEDREAGESVTTTPGAVPVSPGPGGRQHR